jgi:D-alanyl-D-alanine carboxypeptidase
LKKSAISILIVLLIISAPCLYAENGFNKAKLDEYLSQLENNEKIMCGVAISKDGVLVYENYIGYSSVDESIQNSKLTRFRVGSITKVFTATIVFQLVEEGKLSLDTKLAQFYPQIKNAEQITISDLLSHRSGIQNFTAQKAYKNYYRSKKTKADMLKIFSSLDSEFVPNKKMKYSNTNYVLLGYIIEDVTGKPYSKILQERIVSKLNLPNTYYGGNIDTQTNEAASYRFKKGMWLRQPATDMSIPHGAGAIVSNPADLSVFIESLFKDKLISDALLPQMKPIENGDGKGLWCYQFMGRTAYGHDGKIDSFFSRVRFFPNERVAISATANGVNYPLNDIWLGILSIYFEEPFDIPDFNAKPIAIGKESLRYYTGTYTSSHHPLDIDLSTKGDQLFGRATGQSAFPLTPYSNTEFRFDPAGIIIKFKTDDKGKVQFDSFVFSQGGRSFLFKER